MSEGVTDWRDLFCGRGAELQQLEAAYRAVARGQGPRLVVVLGDRGMGKTRLVQELYRRLTTGYDPEDYWPDAALFKGNNLRVAPDLADPQVREHFRRLDVEARVMPFLWWGFRLADPLDRNAVRADLSAHRRTLDPHLGKLLHERRAEAASDRVKDAWWEVGKSAINLGLSALPGIGAGAALAFDGADKAKGGYAAWQGRHLQSMQGAGDVAGIEELAHADLLDQTLSDVAEVLAPTGPIPQVPVVVFCDDAQFARSGGDEGALRLLISLWRRAVDHRWPLMLVASPWNAGSKLAPPLPRPPTWMGSPVPSPCSSLPHSTQPFQMASSATFSSVAAAARSGLSPGALTSRPLPRPGRRGPRG